MDVSKERTRAPVQAESETSSPLVSVVLPCLNEEDAIGECVDDIVRVFAASGIDGEVVVSDNGSSDASVAIAQSHGARVVHQPRRGYGNAYLKGFTHARGRYLVMADADGTYDFRHIPEFLLALTDEGYDFVTGSRYLGGGHAEIKSLHRWFGNPALTRILNMMFRSKFTDVYCGMRAFSRDAYETVKPMNRGMEFNLELAINAALSGLKIKEIPIRLGARKGMSKLRTFRDGWRSLRMMLLYSPNKLFLWPGFLLLAMGLGLHAALVFGFLYFDGRPASAVTGVFATIASVVGFQTLSLGLQAKSYSWSRRFDRNNRLIARFHAHFRLERALLLGGLVTLAGMTILAILVGEWIRSDLLPLPRPEWASLGATLTIIGIMSQFSALLISAMAVQPYNEDARPLAADLQVSRAESTNH